MPDKTYIQRAKKEFRHREPKWTQASAMISIAESMERIADSLEVLAGPKVEIPTKFETIFAGLTEVVNDAS